MLDKVAPRKALFRLRFATGGMPSFRRFACGPTIEVQG